MKDLITEKDLRKFVLISKTVEKLPKWKRQRILAALIALHG